MSSILTNMAHAAYFPIDCGKAIAGAAVCTGKALIGSDSLNSSLDDLGLRTAAVAIKASGAALIVAGATLAPIAYNITQRCPNRPLRVASAVAYTALVGVALVGGYEGFAVGSGISSTLNEGGVDGLNSKPEGMLKYTAVTKYLFG